MTAETSDQMPDPPALRVSVVIPVWQPDDSFDELIRSLDAQTLPPSQFEVVLCDDGSGPATQERLAEIARTRPHVRVLALPHSGWPGTPRNRGIEAAAGRYVQFVDQDDRLFPGALEKLSDYADTHASDVVIGREVGVDRDIPRRIFERDVPRAVLGEDALLQMLTPHKMFRTAFLREHDIRFPEGRVRLEDHLFVMEAYFRADVISILASEPCYAWVKRPGSASAARIDPEEYFPHLENVLDLVEANTEPGALRDTLLRHWLRSKILNRIRGARMLRYPHEYREQFLDVVGPLVRRRFGPGVDAGLPEPSRIRVALLRADRRADLIRLAQFEAGRMARVEVTRARWSRGGGLNLTLSAAAADDTSWPPDFLRDLPAGVLRADTEDTRVDLALSESGRSARRLASRTARDASRLTVAIDPLRVFASDDPSTGGRVEATVHRGGWSMHTAVTASPRVLSDLGRSPLLAGRRCTLELADDGTVALRRQWPGGRLRDLAGRAARRARRALSSART